MDLRSRARPLGHRSARAGGCSKEAVSALRVVVPERRVVAVAEDSIMAKGVVVTEAALLIEQPIVMEMVEIVKIAKR